MKYVMCYMLLLFAANTDSVAGVLRGLRDANIAYHLEPRNVK